MLAGSAFLASCTRSSVQNTHVELLGELLFERQLDLVSQFTGLVHFLRIWCSNDKATIHEKGISWVSQPPNLLSTTAIKLPSPVYLAAAVMKIKGYGSSWRTASPVSHLQCVFIMCVLGWEVRMEVVWNSSQIRKCPGTRPLHPNPSAFWGRGQLTSDQLDKRFQGSE